MCILFVYTLLNVISYYEEKSLYVGWVGGWGELYPVLFWIFFNFAKPLSKCTYLEDYAISASDRKR